jgi:hypothetical protein
MTSGKSQDYMIQDIGSRKTVDPQVFCWCVWSACFTWILAIIWMQGPRYPWSDEWQLVPYLANARPITVRWLWVQHVDHRIPMIKLAYLVLYHVWPGDFRLPILLNAVLMGIASAILIHAAKTLRGHTGYAEVFFPLIMMHTGLGLLWWGFQIQFVLSAFLLCVVMAAWCSIVMKSKLNVSRALGVALPMLFLPSSGTNGVVLSFGVISFAMLVLRWYRRSSGGQFNAAAILWGAIGLTILVDAFYFVGFSRVDHHWGALTVSSFLRTTVGVILAPFGILVSTHRPFTLSVLGVLGGWLLLKIVRTQRLRQQSERQYFVGLVVLCASAIAVAVSVGYGRGARGWTPDLAWHYSVLVIPFYAGAFLLARRMQMSILPMMMAVMMTGLYSAYVPSSVRIARDYWLKTKLTDNALSASTDVDSFVERQVSNLYFVDNEWTRGCVREGLLALGRESDQTDRGVVGKYNKFLYGQYALQRVKILPNVSRSIKWNFDEFQDRGGAFFIRGWAYIKDQDAKNSLIYIVLASPESKYLVQVAPQKRHDVTVFFGNADYDDSGFDVMLHKGDLEVGEYRVGIYIKKGKVEAFQYTSRLIRVRM